MPPIGTAPGRTTSSFSADDNIHFQDILIGEAVLDNTATVRHALAVYIFKTLLVRNRKSPGAEMYGTHMALLFADYFTSSFDNQPPPNMKPATWKMALWDIRREFGKEFCDRALFYTYKTIDDFDQTVAPKGGYSFGDKELNMYIRGRFSLGRQVVANGIEQSMAVDRILEKHGLLK